ncbi:hypothetical protein [Paraburkholderia hospita]|uniref:hypothetical protein n=1 Tax=Paraburkholderia hospita TaxID=169430 RepID=UPI00191C5F45|nr:hypothetical protein [Paraburkholderia hospita]
MSKAPPTTATPSVAFDANLRKAGEAFTDLVFLTVFLKSDMLEKKFTSTLGDGIGERYLRKIAHIERQDEIMTHQATRFADGL